jgi:hypothetical protein
VHDGRVHLPYGDPREPPRATDGALNGRQTRSRCRFGAERLDDLNDLC